MTVGNTQMGGNDLLSPPGAAMQGSPAAEEDQGTWSASGPPASDLRQRAKEGIGKGTQGAQNVQISGTTKTTTGS